MFIFLPDIALLIIKKRSGFSRYAFRDVTFPPGGTLVETLVRYSQRFVFYVLYLIFFFLSENAFSVIKNKRNSPNLIPKLQTVSHSLLGGTLFEKYFWSLYSFSWKIWNDIKLIYQSLNIGVIFADFWVTSATRELNTTNSITSKVYWAHLESGFYCNSLSFFFSVLTLYCFYYFWIETTSRLKYHF